jgi:hypothetical protein
MKLTEILAALPSLSADERARVAAGLKAAAALKGEATPLAPAAATTATLDTDMDLLIDALCAFMRERGIEFSNPTLVKRSGAYQSLCKRPDFLGSWLDRSGMSRNEKRLLFAMTVPLLHQYLSWGSNAVGVNQMLQNLHKLPAVVEGHLPGYARAGALRMIVKRGT